MKHIGKTLRVIRELYGLRQGELAAKIQVSPNYISLVENQKREPSLKFLKRLAVELDLPISVFFWNASAIEQSSDSSTRELLDKVDALFWDVIKSRISASDPSIIK